MSLVNLRITGLAGNFWNIRLDNSHKFTRNKKHVNVGRKSKPRGKD